MADDVSISFGADVGDLASALAVARARVDQFNGEVRKLAREAATAGSAANDNLTNALRNATSSAATAQREFSRLSDAMKRAGQDGKGAADGLALTRQEALALTYTFNDVTASLASGASPMTILMQQGGQLTQAFGGVRETFEKLLPVLARVAPIAAVAAGALAAIKVTAGAYADLEKINEGASAAGVSTGLFQTWIIEAKRLRLTVEEAEKAILHAGQTLAGQVDNFSALGLDAKPSRIAERTNSLSDVLGRDVMSKGLAAAATSLDEMHRAALQLVQDYLSAGYELEGHGRLLDANQARAEAISAATEVWGEAGRKVVEGLRDGTITADDFLSKSQSAGRVWSDSILEAQRRVSEQLAGATAHLQDALTPAMEDLARISVRVASTFAGFVNDIATATERATALVGVLRQAAAGTQSVRDGLGVGKYVGKRGSGLGRLVSLGDDSSEGRSLRDLMADPDVPTPPKRPQGLGRGAGKGHSGHKSAGAGAGDSLAAIRAQIEGELGEMRRGLASKMGIFDEEAKLKLISEDQRIAAVRAAIDEEYGAEKALLQRELSLESQKPQQRQAILNRLKQLEDKHGEDIQRLSFRAAEEAVRPWHALVDQMSSSLSGSITGMIEGTKRLSDAVRDMARAVLRQFVQMGVGAVAEWTKGIATQVALTLAGEQTMTAAKGAGVAARLGLEQGAAIASVGAKVASIVKSIMASAAEAFAGVFGFLAPIMGPAAAGPAAGAMATVSGIASYARYEVGAWSIPREGLAMLHPGEGVLTAAQNSKIHSFLDNFGGASGNTFHVAPRVHFNITAADSRDVARWMNGAGREVMKTIERQVRMGAHLGLKGFGS
jgi:hypothetical protein